MEVNALQQMLSRLKQVQEDIQRQVNSVAVEASAGGGMVTVKMNGQKQLVDVRIEPDVFTSKDQEMLQDLVRAAVNEASRRVDEELTNQMKNLSGGIPGGYVPASSGRPGCRRASRTTGLLYQRQWRRRRARRYSRRSIRRGGRPQRGKRQPIQRARGLRHNQSRRGVRGNLLYAFISTFFRPEHRIRADRRRELQTAQ